MDDNTADPAEDTSALPSQRKYHPADRYKLSLTNRVAWVWNPNAL